MGDSEMQNRSVNVRCMRILTKLAEADFNPGDDSQAHSDRRAR